MEEDSLKVWKMKNLIKWLENTSGQGTSMVSIIIPPDDQLSRMNTKLTEEYGTATNIKNRLNRQSVMTAISSAKERLKRYSSTPRNGLVIYCGTIWLENGKEQFVNIDFEPFKPVTTTLYMCDSRFHVEHLKTLLQTDEKYGFIIVDGHGALFATLSGDFKECLHSFTVDLPNKHGRGGQSALRFARLRKEKRHNYIIKVSEMATKLFVVDNKLIVEGIILAGLADLKNELAEFDKFHTLIKNKIISILDISYGGTNGFNEAIELSKNVIKNTGFIREKNILKEYFNHISRSTNKICYGVSDTMKALELGAVDTLIVHDNLELQNYTLNDNVIENLLEWLVDNHKQFGASLTLISGNTPEGHQYINGFGGIGAILRWSVDFSTHEQIVDAVLEL